MSRSQEGRWIHSRTLDILLVILYCDGPLLHNERLLTDVISTVTNIENYPITRNS
jgi:hypothetical protein